MNKPIHTCNTLKYIYKITKPEHMQYMKLHMITLSSS